MTLPNPDSTPPKHFSASHANLLQWAFIWEHDQQQLTPYEPNDKDLGVLSPDLHLRSRPVTDAEALESWLVKEGDCVIGGFFHRDREGRGPDVFIRTWLYKQNGKLEHDAKIQPINFEATTVQLIAYGGAFPMTLKYNRFEDFELIDSVANSKTFESNIQKSSANNPSQVNLASLLAFLGLFKKLAHLDIIIEVRKTEHDIVPSPLDLARLKLLLSLPGSRFIVRFKLIKKDPDHPSPELKRRWVESWNQAIDVNRPLFIYDDEKPEYAWPWSESCP